MSNIEITPLRKLHSWMYTLLYPAVLGTMLFALMNSITVDVPKPGGFQIAYGLFLIIYFSSQHVENTLDIKVYTYTIFVIDLLELVAIFVFYIILGFVDTDYKIDGPNQITWNHFFIILSITFLFPVITRWIDFKNPFHNFREGSLSLMSIVAAVISISGLCFGVNILSLVLLTIIILIYFSLFVFGQIK